MLKHFSLTFASFIMYHQLNPIFISCLFIIMKNLNFITVKFESIHSPFLFKHPSQLVFNKYNSLFTFDNYINKLSFLFFKVTFLLTKIKQSIKQQILNQELGTSRWELNKCCFNFKKASFKQELHIKKQELSLQWFIFQWESNKLSLLKNFGVIALRIFIEFQIVNFEGQVNHLDTL